MKYIKKYYKIAIIILIIIIILLSPLKKYINITALSELVNSIKDQPYAPIAYCFIYIIGVVFAVPGFALTIIAGPIFGMWQGLLLVVISSNIGCQLTFFISRFLGRDFVKRFIKEDSLADKITKKIEKNGFIVMLYMRALPLFPFNLVNYISGLTSISHRSYSLATFIGMLPGSAVYVYLSVSAVNAKDNPIGLIISIAVLIVFTVITTLWKKKQEEVNEVNNDD